jgi:hypothetical protein
VRWQPRHHDIPIQAIQRCIFRRRERIGFRLSSSTGNGAKKRKGESMSKGNERKKETKKKPAKSLMEKRAAKAQKRNEKK